MNNEQVVCSDCLEHMRTMPENSVDSIVTDPPYGLSFMNKEWDSFGTDTRQPGDEHYWVPDNPYGRANVRYGWNQDKSKLAMSNRAFQEGMTPIFKEALRIAKPGAHLLCFGGTRTFHRMACAIEDAGWEIRDCIMWVYGSGFPKNMDVAKAIDKASGYVGEVIGERTVDVGMQGGHMHAGRKQQKQQQWVRSLSDQAKEWKGWGTCLKPAWEPIIVARKPLDGTVAANVLKWGTGALNINECRVPIERGDDKGRFPANVAHDGSQMVLELFPETNPSRKGKPRLGKSGNGWGMTHTGTEYEDDGSAARFFYCAKASKKDRGEGNNHPTVKPIALMKWLVTLVTPEGGGRA